MADITYVDGVTLFEADAANDFNRLHYTIFGDPANLGAVRTTMAASDTLAGTIEYAVQAEMEAGTSTTLAVTPGRQQYHPSAAKALIKWNGTGTPAINASFNVTSITDNGVGDFTINFTVPFSSAHYIWACGSSATVGSATGVGPVPVDAAPAAGAFRCRTLNSSFASADFELNSLAFFGDQ